MSTFKILALVVVLLTSAVVITKKLLPHSSRAEQELQQGLKIISSNSGDLAAKEHFERAIALNPDLAMAYASLAICEWNLSEIAAAREHIQRAYDLRTKVSDLDRLRIEALYQIISTGNLESANKKYNEYLHLAGDSNVADRSEAHQNLANNYMTLGRYDLALEEMKQYLESNARDCKALGTLEGIYIALARLSEAGTLFSTVQHWCASNPYVVLNRYYLAFLRTETDAKEQQTMEQLLDWGRTKGQDTGVQLLEYSADTSSYRGQLESAAQQSAEATGMAMHLDPNSSDEPARLMALRALREVEVGNKEVASGLAREALQLSSQKEVRVIAALTLARAGDISPANVAASRALASQLKVDFPFDTMMQQYNLPLIYASLELAGRGPAGPANAVDTLAATINYEKGQDTLGNLYPAYVRGLAYLQMGNNKDAVEEFQKLINDDNRGIVLNSVLGPLARLQKARAQAAAGDNLASRESYQAFFTIWRDADPTVPAFIAAKKEYKRLK